MIEALVMGLASAWVVHALAYMFFGGGRRAEKREAAEWRKHERMASEGRKTLVKALEAGERR